MFMVLVCRFLRLNEFLQVISYLLYLYFILLIKYREDQDVNTKCVSIIQPGGRSTFYDRCRHFVTKCGAQGKLYRSVPSRQLLPHFFKHFCSRMCRLATTHNEKANRIFHVLNSHGQRGHVTVAIPDVEFSAVWFCSYTVRHAQ